jgi:hypothetical protein
MTDTDWVEVYVPPEDMPETARKLLDAAGEDRIPEVQTYNGGFRVPADVADKAGVSVKDDNAIDADASTPRGEANARRAEDDDGDRPVGTPDAGGSADAVIEQREQVLEENPAHAPTGVVAETAGVEVTAEQQEAAARASGSQQTGGQREAARGSAQPPAEDLHGQELDDALEKAGLSRSGLVAEKQARLAEWQAAQQA